MAKPPKLPKNVSESYLNQITVLKTLSREPVAAINNPRPYQLAEIAELSGLRDEREVQRYLFILEGQKLVSPHPAGDFTSKTWQITRDGMRALKVIQRSAVQ
ncbi:MAG: hypothetical protein J0M12_14795 [Deltaproteobacteria bacterium]|nr:hypothetical protein [Deltaproteobacteria bacterium]